MPFDNGSGALYLQQILQNIDTIVQFLGEMTFADYEADLKTRSAVERQLSMLTEAAFRLGDQASIFCPSVDWRAVRGMGNFLRHSYDKVNDQEIWNTAKLDLPSLRGSVVEALGMLLASPGRNA